jgi:alpha-D-ribose 1-methylphosphonate 5-triphosphate synthase subunit PhnG
VPQTDTADRQAWLSLLASAPEGRAAALLDASGVTVPRARFLKPPEIGSVMVRGRTSGTGSAFNLGEVTVTRCALRLADGPVGHGYVQGRRKACAEAAAKIDALMQTGAADALRRAVLDPLAAERDARRRDRTEKAAATKVEFFTMVRGEDA